MIRRGKLRVARESSDPGGEGVDGVGRQWEGLALEKRADCVPPK